MMILRITALLLGITGALGAREGPNPNAPDSSDSHDEDGLPKSLPKDIRMLIKDFATSLYRDENIQYFVKAKETHKRFTKQNRHPIYETSFVGQTRHVTGYDEAVEGIIRETLLQADAAFGTGGKIYAFCVYESYCGVLWCAASFQHKEDGSDTQIEHWVSGLKTIKGWENHKPTTRDTTVYNRHDKDHVGLSSWGTRRHGNFSQLSTEEKRTKYDALRKVEIPQEKAREAERQQALKEQELRRIAKRKRKEELLQEQRRKMEAEEQKMQTEDNGIVSAEWQEWKGKLLAAGVPAEKIDAVLESMGVEKYSNLDQLD